MCFISVIVPVYNSEKTINRCIDSILSQTFSDFELIIVDDGSSDSSGEISDYYAKIDNRVKVFHKQNGGVSSARNLGLDNVKGKWVTFCDSDDYVSPEWLDYYVRNSRDNVELIVQSFNNRNEVNKDFEGCVADFIETFYDLSIIGYTGNKLFLASIINKYKIRYCEYFTFHEDEVFAYQYLQYTNNVIYTKKSGYNYEIPDFSIKYRKADNFEPYYIVFSIIDRINKVHPIPEAYTFYIKVLYRSLFDSFLKKDSNCKEKLLRYRCAVGNDSSVIRILPLKIRMALKLPPFIVFFILKVMALIRRNL
ncbi:glycosyltransferase family A protein [uncultured Bacteroides sp.]|uniref:glycosyltransferase family 2 protein n=1 Tax=uncultured Bacteroides sp. TaxID=162156 RepID=UPI0025D2498F|nr:glycosyltransferase family A protein [uncultured Bacteroides sp.]